MRDEVRRLRRAPTGGMIPTGASAEGAVAAGGDVVEVRRVIAGVRIVVEEGVRLPETRPGLRILDGDETRHLRGNETRPAVDTPAPPFIDGVAGVRIGVHGDVGGVAVTVLGHAVSDLPGGLTEHRTHRTPRTRPGDFARDRVVAVEREGRPAAGNDVGIGGRIVGRVGVARAVGRTVVAGGGKDRDPLGGGLLEDVVVRSEGRGAGVRFGFAPARRHHLGGVVVDDGVVGAGEIAVRGARGVVDIKSRPRGHGAAALLVDCRFDRAARRASTAADVDDVHGMGRKAVGVPKRVEIARRQVRAFRRGVRDDHPAAVLGVGDRGPVVGGRDLLGRITRRGRLCAHPPVWNEHRAEKRRVVEAQNRLDVGGDRRGKTRIARCGVETNVVVNVVIDAHGKRPLDDRG